MITAEETAAFRGDLLAAGILDPQGTHHEFVSGMHGQKLDFDRIEEGTDLYEQWIDVNKGFIEGAFPQLPEIILGVANGTNRVARDVGERLCVPGLATAKESKGSKVIYLPEAARKTIELAAPDLVVVVEDVGTTGSNSVQAALAAREAGAKNVEVVTTWQRREKLEKLEEAGVAYRAIIKEVLPTYSPDDCEARGFCSFAWKFIPREQ